MEEGSSPLATVKDIQRRLLRPISLPYGELKENSTSRRDSMRKRKLDDYLDPVLLSAICARAKKEEPKKDLDFHWPDDDLKAFMEDPLNDEAIDLNAFDESAFKRLSDGWDSCEKRLLNSNHNHTSSATETRAKNKA